MLSDIEGRPPPKAPDIDSLDEDVATTDFDYQDWDSENTFLVSGPLPNSKEAKGKNPRGTVRSRREALIWARATFGDRLVQFIYHPWRWCFRVRKIPVPAMEAVK